MFVNNCGKQMLAVNFLIFGFGLQSVCAEVVLDGSLGQSGALSGPDYAIAESMGQVQGSNLFHSFSDFNLNNTESATFSGSAGITNIVSRVTGGNVSSIDGTLRSSISGADFYFINPNGIVFGENASLDVSGSFYTTTADYVNLGSDGRFDATQPTNSVLTTSSPSAFGFLDNSVGNISMQNTNLVGAIGQRLSLIGGDIVIAGQGQFGGDVSFLYAQSGFLDLVSVASSGEVSMLGSTPNVANFETLGRIEINGRSEISVRGAPAGVITIRAGEFVMDSSGIDGGHLGINDHSGASIDINVTGRFEMGLSPLSDGSLPEGYASYIQASSYGASKAGDISIVADSIELTGATAPPGSPWWRGYTSIASRVYSTGNSGGINIIANQLRLNSLTGIVTQSFNVGDSGDITLNLGDLIIRGDNNFAFISTSAYNAGSAGNLIVNANNVSMQGNNGFTGLASQVTSWSQYAATSGQIRLNVSNKLEILNGAHISAGVFGGTGDAGNIDITATEVNIAGIDSNGYFAGIYSNTVGDTTTGNGGDINLTATALTMSDQGQITNSTDGQGRAGNTNISVENLDITSGAYITASALGAGNAGNINITATDIDLTGPSSVDGSTGIYTVAESNALSAGNIQITASSLSILDGAEISSSTSGPADGGRINITASDINIQGRDDVRDVRSRIISVSSIYEGYISPDAGDSGTVMINTDNLTLGNAGLISTSAGSAGNGGDIVVAAQNISLLPGSEIQALNNGTGSAGNIGLTATRNISLDNAGIFTAALEGDGGNIKLTATDLVYLNDSQITASVSSGTGNGGNIDIDPVFVVLNNSNITADAQGGNGGNITLVTDNYLASPDSTLSASSNLGVDGSIVVNAPNKEFGGELEAVPEATQDASKLFRNDCVAVGSGFSSFVTAKGGPAVSGSRIFMSSVYHPVQKVAPLKQGNRITQRPGKRKPLLVLAKKGVDCMGKYM